MHLLRSLISEIYADDYAYNVHYSNVTEFIENEMYLNKYFQSYQNAHVHQHRKLPLLCIQNTYEKRYENNF